jgi:hypothetical protein
MSVPEVDHNHPKRYAILWLVIALAGAYAAGYAARGREETSEVRARDFEICLFWEEALGELNLVSETRSTEPEVLNGYLDRGTKALRKLVLEARRSGSQLTLASAVDGLIKWTEFEESGRLDKASIAKLYEDVVFDSLDPIDVVCGG